MASEAGGRERPLRARNFEGKRSRMAFGGLARRIVAALQGIEAEALDRAFLATNHGAHFFKGGR